MTPITYAYIREIMESDRLVDGHTWKRIVSFLLAEIVGRKDSAQIAQVALVRK